MQKIYSRKSLHCIICCLVCNNLQLRCRYYYCNTCLVTLSMHVMSPPPTPSKKKQTINFEELSQTFHQWKLPLFLGCIKCFRTMGRCLRTMEFTVNFQHEKKPTKKINCHCAALSSGITPSSSSTMCITTIFSFCCRLRDCQPHDWPYFNKFRSSDIDKRGKVNYVWACTNCF